MRIQPSNTERPTRGFTLVELMVTLGIVGMTTAAVGPGMARLLPRYRLEQTIRSIGADLMQARMRAVAESTLAKVSFDRASSTYTVWVDGNQDGIENANEKTTYDIPDIRVWTYPVSATFQPDGRVDLTSGYWYIGASAGDGGYRTIYVFSNGSIEIPD